MSTPTLAPYVRITGDVRREVAEQLAQRYNDGASIRELCTQTGYSIGRVRGLLCSAGVTFRGRGGSRRRSRSD